VTALNAILARQGQMNPQAGVMNGQQGLPMGGGVAMSPIGSLPQSSGPIARPEYAGRSVNNNLANSLIPNTPYVAANKRLQAPVGYNRDPRQNAQFNALSPQDQARYYQGGMNPQSGMTDATEFRSLMQAGRVPTQGPAPLLATAGGNPSGRFGSPAQQAGMVDQNQAGVSAPPTASMAAQPLAGAGPVNQAQQQVAPPIDWEALQGTGVIVDSWAAPVNQAQQQAAPPVTGMANPAQSLAGPVQVSPVYEGQISRSMANQGNTREQAMANQAAAVRQGSDYNNDGAVSRQEYEQFRQNPDLTAPTTGIIGSEMSLGAANDLLKRGGNRAVDDLLAGTGQARNDITTASQAALQPLAGYAQSGQDANAMQANLLGANGPAAQAAAMQQFQDSPGQAYLREEQERAVLRNSAATGGTQGGAVLEELQRRAYGLAGTAFNDRVAQLGGLGSQGLTASQGQAGIMGDTGMALSGLAERGAGNLASTRLGIAGQQAGIQGTIAGGRTRAGEQMAQNIGSTTANLANLQNAEGAALAQVLDGGQFAEIMAKAGITDANTLQQLATLLANISTGQGSQSTGLGGIPGVQEQQGGVNRYLSSIPDVNVSDIRLKENIAPIGKIGQHNFYTWDWKAEALPIVGNQGTVGVIAQEAKEIDPESVILGKDGYLRVNYSRILNDFVKFAIK